MSKPGRNDPCPCGSGKKYKKCCMGKHNPGKPSEPVRELAGLTEDQIFEAVNAPFENNGNIVVLEERGWDDQLSSVPLLPRAREMMERLSREEVPEKEEKRLLHILEASALVTQAENPRLTQAGEKIIKEKDDVTLYRHLFLGYCDQVDWLYGTTYPIDPFDLIREGALFSLHLLRSRDVLLPEEISLQFRRAFPGLEQWLPGEKDFDSLFNKAYEELFLRFFCCELGLLTCEKDSYRRTLLFDRLFAWKI